MDEDQDGRIRNPGKCSIAGCAETRLPFEHSEEVCEQHYFECHRGMIVAWVKERRALIAELESAEKALANALRTLGVVRGDLADARRHAEAVEKALVSANHQDCNGGPLFVICPHCKRPTCPMGSGDGDVMTDRAYIDCLRAQLVEVRREERERTIFEVAAWVSSSMASTLFGSESWGLRKRLAEIIKGRLWETTFKNEEMRP